MEVFTDSGAAATSWPATVAGTGANAEKPPSAFHRLSVNHRFCRIARGPLSRPAFPHGGVAAQAEDNAVDSRWSQGHADINGGFGVDCRGCKSRRIDIDKRGGLFGLAGTL